MSDTIQVDSQDMLEIAQALENAHSFSLAQDLVQQYQSLRTKVTTSRLTKSLDAASLKAYNYIPKEEDEDAERDG